MVPAGAPATESPLQERWVAIAALLRPQGRRGELLCEPLSDLPEIFATGRSVTLAATMPETRAPDNRVQDNPVQDSRVQDNRILEEHWFPTGKNAGRVVLQLSGCASIGEAEALAGRKVWVASTELPGLEADTYFVGDLVGCGLVDGNAPMGAVPVGTVIDLEFPTGPDGRTRLEEAAPLLAVRLVGEDEDAEPVLVPFVRAWLESVDVAGRRIVMRLPEGLLAGTDDELEDGDPEGEEPDGGGEVDS